MQNFHPTKVTAVLSMRWTSSLTCEMGTQMVFSKGCWENIARIVPILDGVRGSFILVFVAVTWKWSIVSWPPSPADVVPLLCSPSLATYRTVNLTSKEQPQKQKKGAFAPTWHRFECSIAFWFPLDVCTIVSFTSRILLFRSWLSLPLSHVSAVIHLSNTSLSVI